MKELGWTPLSWAVYQKDLADERTKEGQRGGRHHTVRA
jgi:hypothetical protein